MLKYITFSLSVLFLLCCADPQIHSLNTILSSADYTFTSVEIGAKFFVASNDNTEYLKLITARVGDKSYTLDNLARTTNVDQTQTSVTITDKLTISTTNSDENTNKLTGYIYITTAAQANDPNFSVYVALNKLTVQKTNNAESTSVILNTQLIETTLNWFAPLKTAYVSDFAQAQTTSLNILRGVPSSNTADDDNQKVIFKNPMKLDMITDDGTPFTKQQFFNHVEPLQLSVDSWFIKANGSYSLTIQNTWKNMFDYHTNSPTTTGLILTKYLFNDTNIRFEPIYPKGISGSFLSVNILQNYMLNVTFYDATSTFSQTYTGPNSITQATIFTKMSANRLSVGAPAAPGEFYIQYFGVDGPPVSSTLPPSTVSGSTISTIDGSKTTTIMTTTNSSNTYFTTIFIVLICILKFAMNQH